MKFIFRKIALILTTLIELSGLTFAQEGKRPLQITDLENWPELNYNYDLSPNGKYLYYSVANEISDLPVLHLKRVDNTWEKRIVSLNSVTFSSDSKYAFFLKGDTLIKQTLGSARADSIFDVSDFRLFQFEREDYIAYHSKDDLIIKNLKNNRQTAFKGFLTYFVSPDHSSLMIVTNSSSKQILMSYVFSTNQTKEIWRAISFGKVIFSKRNDKIAFDATNMNTGTEDYREVFVYDLNKGAAIERIHEDKLAGNGLKFLQIEQFVADDKCILITLSALKIETRIPHSASVDVYNYSDTISRVVQNTVWGNGIKTQFNTVFRFSDQKVIYREGKFSTFSIKSNDQVGFELPNLETNKNVLLDNKPSLILLSDGTKNILNFSSIPNDNSSPNGKYVILEEHKGDSTDFISYNITSGKCVNLTKSLRTPFSDLKSDEPWKQRGFRIQKWLMGKDLIILGDNFDLWEIDLNGKLSPKCLTGGYGRRNEIRFQISELNNFENSNYIDLKSDKVSKLILTSFNYKNIDNDYYEINIHKSQVPKRLTNGGYQYEAIDINARSKQVRIFNKAAKNVNSYLISKQNTNEKNLFITSDFKNFRQISKINPEKKFNWFDAKLIPFTRTDNKKALGILYKPQNFSESKKYPVIFYSYQQESPSLNNYISPALCNSIVNIPYYVSNGYLVYVYDINVRYDQGNAAESAMRCLTGAANEIVKLPFVDSTKMAFEGYSWSGFLSNYFVTHTNRFTAAASGGGFSDMFEGFGAVTKESAHVATSIIAYDDLGSPFANLQNFIKNSPKLYADKVTTPLLILHNQGDARVNFTQDLGFFNVLSDLGKKVWLLSYDGEGHGIFNSIDNQIDYTIRLKQFFDYYLKNAPAPKWMVEGVPANMKQIHDGLGLEPVGVKPR
ncbi:dipeptidyl aminopeptidase/acylaminoacyl peptidase [Mucilaginibacter gracilis]|uniref:Dipeptidyl aminopeptidase/acylaminoacyl peptidase n=1 Tax=Mucilaginibacter gracilis TaxID=423350 RepID=A0A495J077_9SPHI|nr:prolyl oligopeptidase family serine peptidase [Mucilaginibacter gracilis]RKR82386.1 dipeptidyl aminopeptidase/acylaminoacyl peptidase [Mucilaginibacter gracilis]